MNYRHAFHAGNFADVMKHAVLAAILTHLRAKPGPFCVVDTHAGIGGYDLAAGPAQRTGEHAGGIAALFDRPPPHTALAPYLDVVRALNPDGTLRWYPGSPRLARALMRPQDRLVAVELHPDDVEALRGEFAGDRQTVVLHKDAYAALKSQVPPRERRGVVLVDPPFEAPDEFSRLAAGLAAAHRRWATGTYAVWYPIKERAAVWRFQEALEATGIRRILQLEITVHPEDTHLRLNGCGMAVVNPPWTLADSMAEALPALHAALPTTGGGAAVGWLVPE